MTKPCYSPLGVQLSLVASIIAASAVSDIASAVSAPHPSGVFATVGNEPGCTYNTAAGDTLQQAITAGFAELRITNTQSFNPINLVQSITITGGYDSCLDAQNDIPGNAPSVIDGHTFLQVITIPASGVYTLENLTIQNGNAGTLPGGGIHATANDQDIWLENVTVTTSQAAQGGGIAMTSSGRLVLSNSRVIGNIAEGGGFTSAALGGGIYLFGRELIMVGESSIAHNSAEIPSLCRGGGIYADTATITLIGGENSFPQAGIVHNSSCEDGGGIYATDSTLNVWGSRKFVLNQYYGSRNQPFRIADNSADAGGSSAGTGGGIFVTASTVSIEDTVFANNLATRTGGAIATNNTDISIGSTTPEKCWSTSGCNQFIANSGGLSGGAMLVGANAQVNATHATFQANTAPTGAAAVIGGANAELRIESSLIYDNAPGNDQTIFELGSGADLQLGYSTLVENTPSDFIVRGASSTIQLFGNIAYNPAAPLVSTAGGNTLNQYCLIADDTHQISAGQTLAIDANAFDALVVDATNDNFRLQPGSLGQDYCDEVTGVIAALSTDFDGQARGYDEPSAPNNGLATVDIGMDELIPVIFIDGFELQN